MNTVPISGSATFKPAYTALFDTSRFPGSNGNPGVTYPWKITDYFVSEYSRNLLNEAAALCGLPPVSDQPRSTNPRGIIGETYLAWS